MDKQMIDSRYIAKAGIIAALYIVFTLIFAPISYGPVQIRFAEGLILLALIEPAAIPAIFIGCIFSNLSSPFGIADVFLGSFISLIAAYLTSNAPNRWIGVLPPVILNGFLTSAYLVVLSPTVLGERWAYWPMVGSIMIGELISVGIVGNIVLEAYKRIIKE